ncbi:DUF4124 domain-containing protein [Acidovorax sp.]|uniref:DUF4124 domain-containing protein n=1 Tax=Acidovorax sp. TaxID=1872122 RepID=UPI002620D552|nr:DUF4124 domain-containing protein [Acidovorax sp.]
MNPIRTSVVCILTIGFLAPAWAINKCTGTDGKVSFQDAPCVGEGEKIEVKPVIQGATPIQTKPATTKEGAFGAAWQRKNYLQTQGVPQARAAVERSQQECVAQPEVTTHAGPLRRSTLASGSVFAQERATAAADSKAACEARTNELRKQLDLLEDELRNL